MKTKELEEMKIKPTPELAKALADYQGKLWTMRADLALGKVKNVAAIRDVKRSIAQIATILNEKSHIVKNL